MPTTEEIKKAIARLQAEGVSMDQLKRAARRVRPTRPRRTRDNWAVDKSQSHGTCHSLSVNEMLARGFNVDES